MKPLFVFSVTFAPPPRFCHEEPYGLHAPAGFHAEVRGLGRVLRRPADGEEDLGVEPGQLLPPGVDPPVAGPVRLLCVEEARPRPYTLLLTAGDGMDSHRQDRAQETKIYVEKVHKLTNPNHQCFEILSNTLEIFTDDFVKTYIFKKTFIKKV